MQNNLFSKWYLVPFILISQIACNKPATVTSNPPVAPSSPQNFGVVYYQSGGNVFAYDLDDSVRLWKSASTIYYDDLDGMVYDNGV